MSGDVKNCHDIMSFSGKDLYFASVYSFLYLFSVIIKLMDFSESTIL